MKFMLQLAGKSSVMFVTHTVKRNHMTRSGKDYTHPVNKNVLQTQKSVYYTGWTESTALDQWSNFNLNLLSDQAM